MRTEKFVGAENWGLRPIVETLATLLLVSLALFFIALVDYLWTVNETVAIVVLTFAAAGALLYLLMVVLATIFPTCPFQTGPSAALKLPYLMIQRAIYSPEICSDWSKNFPFESLWKVATLLNEVDRYHSARVAAHYVLFSFLFVFVFIPLLIFSYIVFALVVPFLRRHIPRNGEPVKRNMAPLHAISAILMVETGSNADSVVTVADNIPLIPDIEAVRLIATSPAIETLFFHLQKYVLDIQSGNEIDVTDALVLAKAVVHVMSADPRRTAGVARNCLPGLVCLGEEPSLPPIPIELDILLSCVRCLAALNVRGYYPIHHKNIYPITAEMLSANQSSSAIIWLRHCKAIAACNEWDGDVMIRLVQQLSNMLHEELKPEPVHISRVMGALLAILGWYSCRNHRNGNPSQDGSGNVQPAWTVQESQPPITQLVDTLNEPSRYYATENPATFAAFIHCQRRPLAYINTLYVSYDVMEDDHLQTNPPLSLACKLHSSLNSNIECLLTIRLCAGWGLAEVVADCKEETVKTLQRLLLTSAAQVNMAPTNLAVTAGLALRVKQITEREQLLQGTLYSIFIEMLLSNGPYCPGFLQSGQAVSTLLVSPLRLHIWLHPSVTNNQTWDAFKSFARVMVATAIPYWADVPLAWDEVLRVVREDNSPQYSCVVLCMLQHAPKVNWSYGVPQQMDEERLVNWFVEFMQQVQKDRSTNFGKRRRSCSSVDDSLEDSAPAKREGGHWTTTDAKCAGHLFLDAWDAAVNADSAGSSISQLSRWTTSEAIEAFATWLVDYDGNAVEVKLDDTSLMRIVPNHDLMIRFINHATLTNNQAAQNLKLQIHLEQVRQAAEDGTCGTGAEN
ncbi:hypothetical protein FRB93_011090 [Tulasnella sp. JGI-2019a]|nr:hypothetical protein FRB93_011090 [Tulasnella sp. JGI-2019a]